MEENNDVTVSPNLSKMPLLVFFRGSRNVLKMDSLGKEILKIAFPAALALAADPVASLIDTAFIGHLGPVQLAAVGVSIAIFNQASRITIYPLVSITTSFVAEEDTLEKLSTEAAKIQKLENEFNGDFNTNELVSVDSETNGKSYCNKTVQKCERKNRLVPSESELDDLEKGAVTSDENDADAGTLVTQGRRKSKSGKRHIASASTAMVFGTFLGILQAILLVVAAKPLLSVMGVKYGFANATICGHVLDYKSTWGTSCSSVAISLFEVTVACDAMNIILDPILIFVCHLGVSGAAIAHVLSQYLMFFILLWMLMKQVDLLPPSLKTLQYRKFCSNGILLMTRVIAVTFCVTLAASLAARMGPITMAAFQVCLQVWLMSSLLADGLAVAGQAILACAFAAKDLDKVTDTACRVLQMSFVFGLGLTVVVGVGLYFGAPIFTKDDNVLRLIHIAVPFVAGTQTINSISFVFDGVNYGAADFKYAAYSMVIVAICSVASLFCLSKTNGFIGIWIALTIYMALRTFAGVWRMGTGTGPWRFLRRT